MVPAVENEEVTGLVVIAKLKPYLLQLATMLNPLYKYN